MRDVEELDPGAEELPEVGILQPSPRWPEHVMHRALAGSRRAGPHKSAPAALANRLQPIAQQRDVPAINEIAGQSGVPPAQLNKIVKPSFCSLCQL